MPLDGSFDHLLDQKARVVLPSRLRHEFQGRKVHVTVYPGGCVAVWTPEAHERVYEPWVEKMKRRGPSGSDMARTLAANSEEVELDPQFRFFVPPKLRDFAELELGRPLVVVGNGDHVELWQAERWESRQRPCLDQLLQGTSDLFFEPAGEGAPADGAALVEASS